MSLTLSPRTLSYSLIFTFAKDILCPEPGEPWLGLRPLCKLSSRVRQDMLDRRIGSSASLLEERINTQGAEVFIKSCRLLLRRLEFGVPSDFFRRNLNDFLFCFPCGELWFGFGKCCFVMLGSGPTKDAVLASSCGSMARSKC